MKMPGDAKKIDAKKVTSIKNEAIKKELVKCLLPFKNEYSDLKIVIENNTFQIELFTDGNEDLIAFKCFNFLKDKLKEAHEDYEININIFYNCDDDNFLVTVNNINE
jgi:hypothetical protein